MLKSLVATCTGILLATVASAQSSPLSTEDIGDWKRFQSLPSNKPDPGCVNRWFNAQDLTKVGNVLTVDILCETNQDTFKDAPEVIAIRIRGMIASVNRTQFNCQTGEVRNVSLDPAVRVYSDGKLWAVTEFPSIGVIKEPKRVLLTQAMWDSVENEYNYNWTQPKDKGVFRAMLDELCDQAGVS